jgi:hypothetical protein
MHTSSGRYFAMSKPAGAILREPSPFIGNGVHSDGRRGRPENSPRRAHWALPAKCHQNANGRARSAKRNHGWGVGAIRSQATKSVTADVAAPTGGTRPPAPKPQADDFAPCIEGDEPLLTSVIQVHEIYKVSCAETSVRRGRWDHLRHSDEA